MEAGYARINSLTVIQASQGLAAYLLANVPLVSSKGVVVGHDARHNSEKFAKLSAAAFVAKGIKVWWYDDYVHTPLVPFGIFELGAAAGVMITASHVSYRIAFGV
jgi:phosphoglucomutase